MTAAEERFRALLKDHAQSLTTARLTVFRALLGREPLSMHELVHHTPGTDRASVYRAITLFERLGVVQRLHTGWKYKVELSDMFAEHHHHMTCTQCGATIIINGDELEQLLSRLAVTYAFTPTAHQLEIQGLCRRCRDERTTDTVR
jgi:Fur family transcriptional regulator, ferric uptake regulator